jgi:transposase-like protein
MSHGQWCKCPNCTQDTAMHGKNGKLRCIPCGYGLTRQDEYSRVTPEESARRARKMRGER